MTFDLEPRAELAGKCCIIDTEMLESMIQNSRPTRAEVSDVAAALAAAVRRIEEMQDIKVVIVYTASGFGARMLSKSRLSSPVLVLSHNPGTVRRCCLYYGIVSREVPEPGSLSEAVGLCLARCRETGMAVPGDRVVVVAAHPIGVPGSTKVLVLETLK